MCVPLLLVTNYNNSDKRERERELPEGENLFAKILEIILFVALMVAGRREPELVKLTGSACCEF